jgi:hypothetical protein
MQSDHSAVEPSVNDVKRKGMLRIRLRWVNQVSEAHFIYNLTIHRSVLRNDSNVRKYGLNTRLPKGRWQWLCGDGDTTATGAESEEY